MAPRAVIEEVEFREDDLATFVAKHQSARTRSAIDRAKFLLDYPTVYVVHEDASKRKYRVYVGETSNIAGRTKQHLRTDITVREDWKQLEQSASAKMYVIGHEHFNKSLTLDVEDRIMLYLTGSDSVHVLHNRKRNPQNDYHTRDILDSTFIEVWRELHRRNPVLFPNAWDVTNSALFKASPFHKLNDEQFDALALIRDSITEVRESARAASADGEERTGHLVLVEGSAGSGKTVLLSALFYELSSNANAEDEAEPLPDVDAHLVVNHDEQLTVYAQIASKLGLTDGGKPRVSKATNFINQHGESNRVEVALVDEAHLLWTQGNQGYQGQNQLEDILARADVVVAVFDPAQVLQTNQWVEPERLDQLRARADRIISLDEQMRIRSSPETHAWIRELVHDRQVTPIPSDSEYEIKVFETPGELHSAIKEKARDEETRISRLTASFDWPYSSKRRPPGGTWNVSYADLDVPWNLQIEYSRESRRQNKGKSWIERPESIDECGSHYTVQGLDLSYAGVVIGPSVKFRDGRIVFDPSASENRNATKKRTLPNGDVVDVSAQLIENELNVLMTRGVHGLYLFACDPELQQALLDAQG